MSYPLSPRLRAASCLVALLTAGAASSAQATLVDLGAAGSFNAFVFGSFSGVNGDTQGPLAAGGSVTLSSWAVNSNASTNVNGYALVVGGSFTGGNGSVNGGKSYVGGAVAGNFTLGTVDSGAAPVDFTAAAGTLKSLSTTVATASSTGSYATQYGGGYFTGTGADVEVFNLSAADFNSAGWFSTSNIKQGATVIVNVAGGSLAMGGTLNPGQLGSNVLFNFYEASSLSLKSIDASVLAPFAAVSGSNGNLTGTLVASSFQGLGGYEFHSDTFTPVNILTAVPEPGTWALMAGGLVAVAALRRRQRGA